MVHANYMLDVDYTISVRPGRKERVIEGKCLCYQEENLCAFQNSLAHVLMYSEDRRVIEMEDSE